MASAVPHGTAKAKPMPFVGQSLSQPPKVREGSMAVQIGQPKICFGRVCFRCSQASAGH
jgi:hypothetical protein